MSESASELDTTWTDRGRKRWLMLLPVAAVGVVAALLLWPAPRKPQRHTPVQVEAPPPAREEPRPKATVPPVVPPVSIRVVSTPPGAAVWLEGDSASRGSTPLSLQLEGGAVARVRTVLEGYEPVDRIVHADADQTIEIALTRSAKARRPRPKERPVAPDRSEYRKLGD